MIVAGVCPILGETEEEAKRKYLDLQDLIRPEIGWARLSQLLGFDVTSLPLDGPLQNEIPETNFYQSRQRLIVEMARGEKLSLRELYLKIVTSYGHSTLIGTPEMIATQLSGWYDQRGADGFMVLPPVMPAGIREFTENVVPILQRAGK